MTSGRAIEYRVTQQVLQRRMESGEVHSHRFVNRFIAIVAIAGGMLLLGSFFQELMWAIVAGAGIVSMGLRS